MGKIGAKLDVEGATKMLIKETGELEVTLEDSTSTLREITWDPEVVAALGENPSLGVILEFLVPKSVPVPISKLKRRGSSKL